MLVSSAVISVRTKKYSEGKNKLEKKKEKDNINTKKIRKRIDTGKR